MTNRRSYLESVNTGRQRRPATSLDELNRTLQALEQQLDRPSPFSDQRRQQPQPQPHFQPQAPVPPLAQARAAYAPRPAAFAPARPTDRPTDRPAHQSSSRPISSHTPRSDQAYGQPYASGFGDSYGESFHQGFEQQSARTDLHRASRLEAVARDMERSRRESDGLAAASQIAAELSNLREEMRQQMAQAMTHEFEGLRGEINRLAGEIRMGAGDPGLYHEVERLAAAISELANHSDSRNVNVLRQELSQVQAALGGMAREDTLREVNHRWDEFDRRMTRFEEQIFQQDHARGTNDAAIHDLNRQLTQIATAVQSLPDSHAMRVMDERVTALAGAVDHFALRQDGQSAEIFDMIGERLDEISRAIAASASVSQSHQMDVQSFQRIEARMSSLAQQIEELVDERPLHEVLEQLAILHGRVDEIGARAQLPQQAIEHLGQQLSSIIAHIESQPIVPDMGQFFEDMDRRFAYFSETVDQRHADSNEQSNLLFRELESRLDSLVSRLEATAQSRPEKTEIVELIDDRFSDLAQRLHQRLSQGPEAASIRDMEARLGDIATRFDETVRQVETLDRSVVDRLEAQVSELAQHLSDPGRNLPELDNLSPRLDQIERSIASNHESLLEAARNAAAKAIREISEGSSDPEAVADLSGDLRSLEELTRKSDERNSKTFEAIHDTLIKIVDRIGTIEGSEPQDDDLADSAAAFDSGSENLPDTDSAPIHRAKPSYLDELARADLASEEFAPSKPLLVDAPSIVPGGNDEFSELPSLDEVEDETAQNVEIARPATPRSPAQAAAEAAAAAINATTEKEVERPGSIFSRVLRRKESAKAAIQPVVAAAEMHALADRPSIPEIAPEARPEARLSEMDLDQPLAPQDRNRPLEPGSGGPDLNAIMRRVRDERQAAGQEAAEDSARSDFIAAARRAAQAAAAEADMERRKSFSGDAGSRKSFGDMVAKHRKKALLATVAVAIGLGGLQLGKIMLGERQPSDNLASERSALPEPLEVQQVNSAQIGASAPESSIESSIEATIQAAEENALINAPEESKAQEFAEQVPSTDLAHPDSIIDRFGASSADQSEQSAEVAPAMQAPAVPEQESGLSTSLEVPPEAGPTALREAAQDGDQAAMFEIGNRYAEGRNGESDQAKAASWFEKAAELGFAPAQFRIGNLYEKGIGVERDIAKARTYYEKAAKQGNANAMHNLAVLYAMGADGDSDNEKAARWFQAAADHGVTDSQFNLGILAARGIGLKQDLEASYKWFSLVAKAGDKDAAAKRDEVAKSMTHEQLQKGRATVDLWRAAELNPKTNNVDVPEEWRESQEVTSGIDMVQAVKNIQNILNKNGFDAGGADGVMGGKTKTAIKAFQKANGLEPDGEVNEPLVRALLARK